MCKFEIIENTDKAKENFEKYYYGSQRYDLTEEDLNALREGKCLATDINSEYVIFIELLEEGKKMCEYCNLLSGDIKNIFDDDEILAIERHNNTFELVVNGILNYASININYCPMCGRKLGE